MRDTTKTYIGKPCKHGHDGTRYTSSGQCVQCVQDRGTQRLGDRAGVRRRASEAKRAAERAGEVAYQGGPCKRGHNGMRYVSNGLCVQCAIDHATKRQNAARRGRPARRYANSVADEVRDACASLAVGDLARLVVGDVDSGDARVRAIRRAVERHQRKTGAIVRASVNRERRYIELRRVY